MCPSLSSWRAWIEILLREGRLAGVDGRSPHGERGLKSGFGLILADRVGRSPHGERGLKYGLPTQRVSPPVALLMESVD